MPAISTRKGTHMVSRSLSENKSSEFDKGRSLT